MKKYTVHMTPAASNALAQIFEYIAYELLAPDDTFFDVHMDGNIGAMQLLLNTFFHRNDIIVKEVVTQKSANNLYGRSARFDVIAVDSDGKIYNCEIQRADFLKHNNKGVKAMCEIMQKLQDEGRAEGRTEERYSTAKRMLLFNEPIEKIVAYTSLSEECIKELAQQTH